MIIDDKVYIKHNNNILSVIDILLDIIEDRDKSVEKSSYYYHKNEREEFLVFLYLFRLLINDKDYLNIRNEEYLTRIGNKLKNKNSLIKYDLSSISNIKAKNEISLLREISNRIVDGKFAYIRKEKKLYFENEEYVDIKWLLTYLGVLLEGKNKRRKNIVVTSVIPDKDIGKCEKLSDISNYFKKYTFCKLVIKQTEKTTNIKEKDIVMLKNAANKYYYHLRKYRQGLENEDSYQIFYNLLKNECHKNNLLLEEDNKALSELDNNYLKRIKGCITDSFITKEISDQIKIIDSIVWKLSNSFVLLDYANEYVDDLIDLIEVLNEKKDSTYEEIKKDNNIKDIHVVMILIILKFVLTYLHSDDQDYSKLDLKNIKPEYMSYVGNGEEEEIKKEIKRFLIELDEQKNELDKYKFERQSITKENLGNKYKNELEMCISNINRVTIDISAKENNIEILKDKLYALRKDNLEKYNNMDLYKYNYSIIRHMVNAFISSGFYLKTNNNNNLLDNIIIIEDYINTDNSFYLEITFSDLLNLITIKNIAGMEGTSVLPKLK